LDRSGRWPRGGGAGPHWLSTRSDVAGEGPRRRRSPADDAHATGTGGVNIVEYSHSDARKFPQARTSRAQVLRRGLAPPRGRLQPIPVQTAASTSGGRLLRARPGGEARHINAGLGLSNSAQASCARVDSSPAGWLAAAHSQARRQQGALLAPAPRTWTLRILENKRQQTGSRSRRGRKGHCPGHCPGICGRVPWPGAHGTVRCTAFGDFIAPRRSEGGVIPPDEMSSARRR
jgi:hypothetical protein